MRISDWSSDVCSSDLAEPVEGALDGLGEGGVERPPAALDAMQRVGEAELAAVHRGGIRDDPRDGAEPGGDAGVLGGDVVRQRVVEHRRVELVGLARSEEHTSELQSLMRNSYAVFG